MKPFRGKPEKPERSNGEIQRVSRSEGAAVERRTACAPPRLPRPVRRERVHFSPSRTSRPVRCRPEGRGGARAALRRSPFSDPRFPAGPPDGTTVARGREHQIRVRPAASADGNPAVGPGADSGPALLLAAVSSDRLRLYAGRRRFSFGYFQGPS